MKKNILFIFIGAMLIFTACEPIEKRQDMGPVLSESQLDISVTVSGNTVKCVNNTAEVLPYWDWQIGHSNQPKTDIYLPLKGTYKLTFTAYCGGGTVSKTQDVVIAASDPVYYSSPKWNYLTNGAAGKTWVWASDIPGGNKVWGNGGYLGNVSPGWWTLGVSDLKDQGGSGSDELYFDLNMAHNVKVTMGNANPMPASGKGNFTMDIADKDILYTDDTKSTIWSYGKMTFIGTTCPLGFEPNSNGKPLHYKYDILKLTADELVLAFPEAGQGPWGTCWFYMFKRKGYTY